MRALVSMALCRVPCKVSDQWRVYRLLRLPWLPDDERSPGFLLCREQFRGAGAGLVIVPTLARLQALKIKTKDFSICCRRKVQFCFSHFVGGVVKTTQQVLASFDSAAEQLASLTAIDPQFVLVFASPAWLGDSRFYPLLRTAFPQAHLLGCSTAGEISTHGILDRGCVVTAVHLDQVRVKVFADQVTDIDDSTAAGSRLAAKLAEADPAAVLIFAPGVNINGTALVDGLAAGLKPGVRIMGGLAGDDAAFRETFTLTDEGVSTRAVVAAALPAGLTVGTGSFGGWKPFGPARKVTRCEGSILYELDGEPALEVYKRYLGEYAKDLPASGLLFPFEMLDAGHRQEGLIRTILGVDEAAGSLALAGAIIPDGYLRLMRASTDALVEGANAAAVASCTGLPPSAVPGLAILVSCVGRKLVMGGRTEEEVETVGEIMGAGTQLAGFYSYGEISPFSVTTDCKLHNQTMTISYLREDL